MTMPKPVIDYTIFPVDVMEFVADMTKGPEPKAEDAEKWLHAHSNGLDDCLETAFKAYVQANWAMRYRVVVHRISLHQGETTETIHTGNDEVAMYAAVTCAEEGFIANGDTAEIEIIENGRERWIDYQDGKRTDFVEGN